MPTINMLDAKSSLSRLVHALEIGQEREFIIARHGRPAAKLVPLDCASRPNQRIGIAKNQFEAPASIDQHDDEIAALFAGDAA